MDKKSIIIAASFGTGKTWCEDHQNEIVNFKGDEKEKNGYYIVDLSEKVYTDILNGTWLTMAEVKFHMQRGNAIILIPSYKAITKPLLKEGYFIYFVRPVFDLKNEYIKEYVETHAVNNVNMAYLLSKNWDNEWIDMDRMQEKYPTQCTIIRLNRYIYLNAVIRHLINNDLSEKCTEMSFNIVSTYYNSLEDVRVQHKERKAEEIKEDD